jgi:uncharacterized protein (TIGR02246 family)
MGEQPMKWTNSDICLSVVSAFARRPTLIAVVVSALFASVPSVILGQVVSDSAAIRARVPAYLEAWNTRDLKALGLLFAEDADFAMGNMPKVFGRTAIERSWQTYFRQQEPERRLRLDIRSLRLVATGAAIMSVTSITGGTDTGGRDLLERRFRGVWVWHNDGDEWRIAAMRGLPLEEDEVVLRASVEAWETLRPDIRGFVAAYQEALDTQNPEAVIGFYRSDAELTVRNSPTVSGRPAIQAWWRSYFDQARPYRALLIIEDVRVIAPRVVLVNVIGSGAVPPRADAAPQAARYTRATWVLTREQDGWRIAELLVLPSEFDEIRRESAGRG